MGDRVAARGDRARCVAAGRRGARPGGPCPPRPAPRSGRLRRALARGRRGAGAARDARGSLRRPQPPGPRDC
ncbi:hypothetical protein FM106_08105 [Brachybacterium faecium]|nr:hypothetical protein FM106_08105 [Brachybacterium faecium]